MDLWWANSNARPLSKTIDKRAKTFKWLTGKSVGKRRTGKRLLLAQYASYNFEAKERESDFPLVLAVYECITWFLNNQNRFSDCMLRSRKRELVAKTVP